MKVNHESKEPIVRRVRDSERGQALYMVIALLAFLFAAAGISIDLGNLYYSYNELQSATQAAARAGGQDIPTWAITDPKTVAEQYSGQTSADYNYHSNLNITNVAVSYACVSTTTYPKLNLPPCATYNAAAGAVNAIQVTETAAVTTFFAKFFGVGTSTKPINISATASASASGGGAIPYNIVMVLDSTASMGSGTDTGCLIGSPNSYSPEYCAQLGVQTLLSYLAPCAANYSSCTGEPGVDNVALMTFPGLCSDTNTGVTTSNCPTLPGTTTLTNTIANTRYAPPDYGCPSTAPPIAKYNNNPEYLLLPFQDDYRASDSAALATIGGSSNLVNAVGAGTSHCGLQTPGGEGTFYAGAIIAAQQYLTANHRTNVQDVMILLSDGNASSSSTQMGGAVKQTVGPSQVAGMTAGNLWSSTGECTQAVNAANYAKTTKQSDGTSTVIYSVSYGSETSGCTSGETSPYNTPCGTMQNIASLPNGTGGMASKYFFSVPQSKSGQGTVCSGAVPITQLNQVFTTIAGDLQGARLIPNSVF